MNASVHCSALPTLKGLTQLSRECGDINTMQCRPEIGMTNMEDCYAIDLNAMCIDRNAKIIDPNALKCIFR